MNVGHYGKCSGAKPIQSIGVNAYVEPLIDEGEFTVFVFRDLPRDKTIGSMITNRRPFGAWSIIRMLALLIRLLAAPR